MSSKNAFAPARGGNALIGRSSALPQTFKCAVDGQWLPNTEFSNKQLARWTTKKRSANDGVTAANIGLICRTHSGAPSNTIQCAGPCGMIKSREDFSGAQKRTAGRWCKDCIDWQSRQDWDSVPTAAPNEANDAEDEREEFMGNHEGIAFARRHDDDNDSEYGSPGTSNIVNDDAAVGTDDESDLGNSVAGTGHYFEDDDDDSDSDGFMTSSLVPATSVPAPKSPMASNTGGSQRSSQVTAPSARNNAMGQVRPQSPRFPAVSRAGSSQSFSTNIKSPEAQSSSQPSASTWVPPHLRVSENLVTLKEKNLTRNHIPSSTPAMPTASAANAWVPPHLRAGPFQVQSTTRAESTSAHLSQPCPSAQTVASSDSRAGIQTMSSTSRDDRSGAARTPTGQSFNAYDPDGNKHRRVVDRTTPATSISAARSALPAQGSSDRQRSVGGNSQWARPDRRKIFQTLNTGRNRTGKDHVPTYDSGSADEM